MRYISYKKGEKNKKKQCFTQQLRYEKDEKQGPTLVHKGKGH